MYIYIANEINQISSNFRDCHLLSSAVILVWFVFISFLFLLLWIIVFRFVILSFGHVSPVLLRFMASDYPFGIVRLFFLCLDSILQLLRLITTINGI